MGRRARVHHRPQPDRLHDLRPRDGHRPRERDAGPGSEHLRRRRVQLPRGRARPPVAPGQLPGDSGHRRFARPVRSEDRQRTIPGRAGGLPTWPTSKTPPPATTKRPTPAPARTWAPKPAGPSADPTAAALSIRWGFGGDDWNLDNEFKWIPLNVYGWPNPLPPAPNPAPPPPGPVLVSTLGQPSTSRGQLVGKRINLEIAYAASFTNGNDAVHTLHGVQIEVTVIPPLQVLGAIRASIYSDDGGKPGVALHQLGLRANPQVGVLTFDAPADTTLAANTTFWLVIDIAHSPTEDFFRTAVTSGTGQDACAIRDWSIGDVAYFRERTPARLGRRTLICSRWPFSASGRDQRVGRGWASPPAATCPATPPPPGASSSTVTA